MLQLADRGYDVVVVDNLSKGHREDVEPSRLRVVDTQDRAALQAVFAEKPCAAVIHFAAFIAVGESMQRPTMYFDNNVSGSLTLFEAMLEAGVKNLVFSSTAAVYGNPSVSPIPENLPYAPVNPYGQSKVMVEQILAWLDRIHGLRSICFRYFNAAGADPAGRHGERHEPETHLIPLLFQAIQTGKPVSVFGTDYPTKDGTCVRDYIHVTDLAEAHILGIEALMAGLPSDHFNVGTGSGFTVREVIDAVDRVTGRKVPFVTAPRRDGDPPSLVADSSRLRETLQWEPRHSSLDQIVRTAWDYAEKHR